MKFFFKRISFLALFLPILLYLYTYLPYFHQLSNIHIACISDGLVSNICSETVIRYAGYIHGNAILILLVYTFFIFIYIIHLIIKVCRINKNNNYTNLFHILFGYKARFILKRICAIILFLPILTYLIFSITH